MRKVSQRHVEYAHHDTLVCDPPFLFRLSTLDLRTFRCIECSSKHNRGVKEVFYEVARVSLTTRARGQNGSGHRPNCIVM